MVAVIRVTCVSDVALGAVNVWHWRIPEANVLTEVNGILGALDAFYEAIDAYLAPAIITIGSRVTTVDQTPNEEIFASALTCTTSGSGSDLLAGCIVANWRGAQVGARYRGRVYLGPLDTDAINSNGRTVAATPSGIVLTALSTLGQFSTNGVEHGTWSRTYNVFTPSAVYGVNPIAGIQRRRLN